MNVLSLFDGISCGRVALARAGVPVRKYFASEVDKHAIAVSQANWPDTVHLGDVCGVQPQNLPKIDLIFAGSPCQGFSSNGTGDGFDHRQSKLFWEFIRLLRALKPKYFLLENVKMKQEWRDVISREVGCEPVAINSSLLSAQSRPRLYWTNLPSASVPLDQGLTIFDILEKPAAPNQPMVTKAQKAFCLTATHGNCLGKDGKPIPSEVAHNLKRHQRTCVRENGNAWRMLTPVECERLQTLPDGYTAAATQRQRYRCLGNGWTVDVIAWLLRPLNPGKKRLVVCHNGLPDCH